MADTPGRATDGGEDSVTPTREELEARVDDARDSITQTVEQIKGTVEERVGAVATTVTGMLSMAEQFQREPVAWSLGALSAGFAMGYSLGRAHHAKGRSGRPAPLAQFADDLASELAAFGGSLVSPSLGAELKATFGVDLSAALERIATMQTPGTQTSRRAIPQGAAHSKRPAHGRRPAPPSELGKRSCPNGLGGRNEPPGVERNQRAEGGRRMSLLLLIIILVIVLGGLPQVSGHSMGYGPSGVGGLLLIILLILLLTGRL